MPAPRVYNKPHGDAPPGAIYIGRGSPWGNRFVIHRGKNKGIKIKTGKYTLRHVARFILIGLYTGTRASAIAAASPRKKEGHAYVDLDSGLYHRLAIGRRATNKRQPTVPLPDRLLVHMRRWYDKKIIANHFVEWQGTGVKSVKNGFARAVEVAKPITSSRARGLMENRQRRF